MSKCMGCGAVMSGLTDIDGLLYCPGCVRDKYRLKRFYVAVTKVSDGDQGPMSSVWDSRIDRGEGKRYPVRPRRALMDWLNDFTGRVISIYADDTGGTKEIIAWLEVDVPQAGKRT